MKRDYRWLASALLAPMLFAWASPVSARIDLSLSEAELVAFFNDSPAVIHEDMIADTMSYAEESVRRTQILTRCALPATPQRFGSPTYIALVLDTARQYARNLDGEMRSEGHLRNRWQAAVLHAWRRWPEPQRQSWLAYMRSPEARRGYDTLRLSISIELFKDYATDLVTGEITPNILWPGWLHAFLVKANRLDAFRAAANNQEAGLGDRFVAAASVPLGNPPTEAQARTLGGLTRQLAARWEPLSRALLAAIDPVAKRDMDAWMAHPQAKEVEDLFQKAMFKVEGDPDFAKFLIAAGQAAESYDRRREALMAWLRLKGSALCEALR